MIRVNPDPLPQIDKILRKLHRRGLLVAHGGKKHRKLEIRGVAVFTIPGTPSDSRSMQNTLSNIKRKVNEGIAKGKIPEDFWLSDNPPKATMTLTKLHSGDKKYRAVFQLPNGRQKTTYFGARGYEDYTMHKDKERMKRYLTRHKARENWGDPTTPGALSRWILWNKPSLRASVQDYAKRFGITVIYRTGKRSNPPTKPCVPDKTPPDLRGEKVRIHVNLHNGCYVLTHKGKVAGYVRELTLSDVTPKVNRSGYDRCRQEGQRNVHAYLEGTLVSTSASTPHGWDKLTYNCKTRGPFFYLQDGSVFKGADQAKFVRKSSGGMEYVEVYVR